MIHASHYILGKHASAAVFTAMEAVLQSTGRGTLHALSIWWTFRFGLSQVSAYAVCYTDHLPSQLMPATLLPR